MVELLLEITVLWDEEVQSYMGLNLLTILLEAEV